MLLILQEPTLPITGDVVPFDIVTKITTPLMLLALCVLAWLVVRLQTLRADTERFKHVPEEKRFELAEELAKKYGVPVSDLPANDRVVIVNRELTGRQQHRKRVSWLVFSAFVITTALWFLSIILPGPAQGEKPVPLAKQTYELRRNDSSLPFTESLCLGNPALPPSSGCVVLLGGRNNSQSLLFDVPDSTAGLRVDDATIVLGGMFDPADNAKPTCVGVSIDGGEVIEGSVSHFDKVSLSDQLSDEPEVSTLTLPVPKRSRNRIRAVGSHNADIVIPAECRAPGLIAFRSIKLVVQWR